MRISVAVPVLNEELSIAKTLKSLTSQVLRPAEIIIADGGSTDGTLRAVAQFDSDGIPITIVRNVKRLPGAGRNVACMHARSDMIACIDADTVASPTWLTELSRPFVEDPSMDVVFGRFEPRPTTPFEHAVAAVVFPGFSRPDGETRRIAARSELRAPTGAVVLIKKTSLDRVGGFPEWARTGEDKLFLEKLLLLGYDVVYNPQAVVYITPRQSVFQLFVQLFSYGKGSAYTRQSSLGLRALVMKYVAGLALLVSAFWLPFLIIALVLGVCLHVYKRGYALYFKHENEAPCCRALLAVPIVLFVADISVILGHCAGLWVFLTDRSYRNNLAAYMRASL